MDKNYKKIILEELKKTDIKSEINDYTDSEAFKNKIQKIILSKLKNNPEFEDKIVEITKNVLIQLHKTLYNKRNFWVSTLKNKSN